jgi:hypothetical protein
MNQYKTIYPIALATLLCLTSCKDGRNEAATSISSSDTTNVVKQMETVQATATTNFIIKVIESADGNPTSEITFLHNNVVTPIASVSGNATITEAKDYAAQGIPANAVAACGSWWAGSGDYFYAIATEKGIDIFQGYIDEMQEDKGYHWKKMKEIAK